MDVDDTLTALAIRAGIEQYGQYHETLERTDSERAEQLGRVGRMVAHKIGADVGIAAVPTIDGMVRVCIIVAKTVPTPEPA